MSGREERGSGEGRGERGWTRKNGPWANAWSLPAEAAGAQGGKTKKERDRRSSGEGHEAPS